MLTKDIQVNGVDLRLYKLSVFTQEKVINKLTKLIAPFFALAKAKDKNMGEALSQAFTQALNDFTEQERHELLFDILLSDKSVKIVVNGAEMPLIGTSGGVKCVMSDKLDDISDLYEIAGEVFIFNFKRFFDKVQNSLKSINPSKFVA